MPISIYTLPDSMRPSSSNYAVDFAVKFRSSDVVSGTPRRRQGFAGGMHTVTLQWPCTPERYKFLMAFYRQCTLEGLLPFVMPLITDSVEAVPHVCYILQNTWRLTEQVGLRYVISATLSVVQVEDAARDEYEKSWMLLSELYGERVLSVANLLEIIVNEQLPQITLDGINDGEPYDG